MSASRLEAWAHQEIRRQMFWNTLAAVFLLPIVAFLTACVWLMVFVFTFFVAPPVGLGDHLVVTSLTLTALLMVILYWEHRKYARSGVALVNPVENDFGEADGGIGAHVMNTIVGLAGVILAPINSHCMYSPGRSHIDAVANAASGRGTMTGPKLITAALFYVPQLLEDWFKALRRMAILPQVDCRAVGAVLAVLVDHKEKITFAQLEREIDFLEDPVRAVADLVHFDGVLFLAVQPRGIFLSTDLRKELARFLRG